MAESRQDSNVPVQEVFQSTRDEVDEACPDNCAKGAGGSGDKSIQTRSPIRAQQKIRLPSGKVGCETEFPGLPLVSLRTELPSTHSSVFAFVQQQGPEHSFPQ